MFFFEDVPKDDDYDEQPADKVTGEKKRPLGEKLPNGTIVETWDGTWTLTGAIELHRLVLKDDYYSSLHLVVERMEELMEGTSLEESGWFQGEIFQITCSVSWYGRFWSTTNFWYSWKRAPLPPSSLAGSRRGTEASRAAA